MKSYAKLSDEKLYM